MTFTVLHLQPKPYSAAQPSSAISGSLRDAGASDGHTHANQAYQLSWFTFAGSLPAAVDYDHTHSGFSPLFAGSLLGQSTPFEAFEQGPFPNESRLASSGYPSAANSFPPNPNAAPGSSCCLALGAQLFSWHLIQLPLSIWKAGQQSGRGHKTGQKSLRNAIRNALEDHLLEPLEAVHLAVWQIKTQPLNNLPPTDPATGLVLLVVGVVAQTALTTAIDVAHAAGLVVQRIVPDIWMATSEVTERAAQREGLGVGTELPNGVETEENTMSNSPSATPSFNAHLIGTPEQAYVWIPKGLRLSVDKNFVDVPAAIAMQDGGLGALATAQRALRALNPDTAGAWLNSIDMPTLSCAAALAPMAKSLGAEPQLVALHEQLYDAAQSSWNFAQFEYAPQPDTFTNRLLAHRQRLVRTLKQPSHQWLRQGLIGLILVNGLAFIAARVLKL